MALDRESECCVYSKAVSALEKHFGYTSFRPGQLEAILPILHGGGVYFSEPGSNTLKRWVDICIKMHIHDLFSVFSVPFFSVKKLSNLPEHSWRTA